MRYLVKVSYRRSWENTGQVPAMRDRIDQEGINSEPLPLKLSLAAPQVMHTGV
jgi:hypothetical protein